jgi:threonylcarbamoyladenosine tRNA methylthiotransferase MtaB
MAGYEVDFLGCKVSHTDAEAIGDALAAAGHVESPGDAKVRVVNACCITAEAEKKSRQKVRRMLAATPDEGRVFVTGCGASSRPEQYAEIDERVTVLPGAAALAAGAIVESADELSGLGCRGPAPGIAPGHEPTARSSTRRTRAFVKVQDGCDFDCSYCIVPIVRGAPRSRDADVVLDEVARRVAQGRREIVLTGVNIGLYRDAERRMRLDRLLLEVAEVAGVARVRISSIESNHVDRRLVAAMASHPKVCPHLHVPLQSGDDAVLAAMGRHYDSRRYLRAIDAARSVLPELNLTTDVIVGYPDEDDAAFAATLRMVDQVGFTKVHAFPFSERPGTHATRHRDPVDRHVKAQRSRLLREHADQHALAHRGRLVGRVDEVMVETRTSAGYGSGAGVLLTDGHDVLDTAARRRPQRQRTGYTRDYSPVRLLDGEGLQDGALVPVRLCAIDPSSGVLEAAAVDDPVAGSSSTKHAPAPSTHS